MPVIHNFGFMWSREKVNWGRPGAGNGSSLDGTKVGNQKRIANFKNQKAIYVLYDRFEQPIQVGQTDALLRRLREHKRDHLRNRWIYFSWFGLLQINTDGKLSKADRDRTLRRSITLGEGLNELEAILIQVLEPRLNRRGANWGGAEEFLQVDFQPDEDDGISDDEGD